MELLPLDDNLCYFPWSKSNGWLGGYRRYKALFGLTRAQTFFMETKILSSFQERHTALLSCTSCKREILSQYIHNWARKTTQFTVNNNPRQICVNLEDYTSCCRNKTGFSGRIRETSWKEILHEAWPKSLVRKGEKMVNQNRKRSEH